MTDWVARFFDQHYGSLGLSWTDEHQKTVAGGLARLLGVSAGMTVFDQCCGRGGLGWGFGKMGIHSIGIDQSASYIEDAIQGAPQGPGRATYVTGDAFEFAPAIPVQAAVNWHSSFGYDGMNGGRHFIRQLRASLEPGRRWLLELPNPHWMKAHFSPILRLPLDGNHAGEELVRHSHWDGQWLCQDWAVFKNGEKTWEQKDTRCWHFSMPDLVTLIGETGDVPLGFLGGLDGSAVTDEDPRVIVLVEKRG